MNIGRWDQYWSYAWLQWAALGIIATAAIVVATVSGMYHARLDAETQRLHSQLALDEGARAMRSNVPIVVEAAPVLLPPVDPHLVLRELDRASIAAGVMIVTLDRTTTQPTAERFGRTDLSVMLKGTYPAAKQVLRDVLERYPLITVSHLRIGRLSGSNVTETEADLVIWSPPSAAAIAAPLSQ